MATILAIVVATACPPPLASDARAQTQDQGQGAATTAPAEIIDDGRLRTDPKRDWFDVFVGVSQIVTAMAAAIGIPFIALQFKHSRDDARSQRTALFQERYQGRDFLKLASPAIAFLQVRDARECIRKIEAWVSREHADDACLPRTSPYPRGPKASVNDVAHLLAFFEDLGTAYNRGELANDVILKSFVLPPVQVFTSGWWFIFWRRGGKWLGTAAGETQVWAEFEHMVNSLRDRSVEARELQPNPSVRVLCLPSKPGAAGREIWARARFLSTSLSAHVKDLPAIRRDLEARLENLDAMPTGQETWEVLVIPESLDCGKEEWQNDQALAGRLADCITRLPPPVLDDALQRVHAKS